MNNNKNIKNIILGALLLFTILPNTEAQLSSTLYYMDWVPHAHQLNPAKQPTYNLYLGCPGASSIQLDAGNNAISFKDVYQLDPATNTPIYSLNANADRDKFFNNFHKNNYISQFGQFTVASFGFRFLNAKEYYFTFDYNIKEEFNFTYSKDFSDFLFNFQFFPNDVTHDFSKTGLRSEIYSELAFGLSREINDEWTVGAKAKFLLGHTYASINPKKLDVYSHMNKHTYDADIDIKGAAPPVIFIDSIMMGLINVINQNDSTEYTQVDEDYAFSPSDIFISPGFALDLGVVYKPSDEWEFSASVLDLGFIKWGGSTFNTKINGTYDYIGPGVDSLTQIFNEGSVFDGVVDSIKESFESTTTYDRFTTALTGKVYLGARYFVHPTLSIGAVSGTRFYNGTIRQKFTLSANVYPVKAFSASISYTMSNYSYNNLGVGLNFNTILPYLPAFRGPCNFYLIIDKIPLTYAPNIPAPGSILNDGEMEVIEAPFPFALQYINFRMGFNLVFGWGKRIKDIPMIE